MTFLNPSALLMSAVAIPIVLLYMLRLRRREVVVSSHFLWQRVLRDQAANTPWQRLQRNLFLLLQLIVLALLVLALARPAVALPTISAGRTVVLLDASASMQTVEADGQTRWQAMQATVRELIGQMGIGDELLLLRVGDVVEVLNDYSSDTLRLRSALESALPGQGRADWETAFTLAAAAASDSQFRIVIVSDGSAGQLADVVLPASVPQPRLISIGQATTNAAITALAVRDAGSTRQIFAQISYTGTAAVEIALALRLDGVLWRSQQATLTPDTRQSFTFAVEQPFDTVQVALVMPPDSDALALDNTAWAVAPAQSLRRVLLVSADSSRYLERVLAVLPNVQVVQGDPTQPTLPTMRYDAYLFEGYLPTILPDADILIVNPPRDTSRFALGALVNQPLNIEIAQPDHPLTRYLDVSALNVRQAQAVTGEGLQALIMADDIALLLAADQGSQQIAVLPFALSDSDLPLQIAFPVLMANALDWFTPLTQLAMTSALRPNDPIRLTLPLEADQSRVIAPDGTPTLLRSAAAYTRTTDPGLYRVEALQGEQVLLAGFVAVNLFDEAESRIAPLVDVPLSGGAPVADTEGETSLRDLSPWLALAALGVLLLEWWLYHRQFQPRLAGGRS